MKRIIGSCLPLLLIPIINIIEGRVTGTLSARVFYSIQPLVILFFVCVEEVLFRGLLPFVLKKITKLNIVQISLCCSFIFALYHLFNLVNGEVLITGIVQCIFAFGVGYCFSALTFVSGNILPAIIMHYLINLTGACFIPAIDETMFLWSAIWIIAAAACFIYGHRIFYTENKRSASCF